MAPSSPTPPLFSLPEAPRGRPLRVARVEADSADAGRLQAMGVCQGRVVEILKGGDPLVIRVVGSRVGIAARLAVCVMVHDSELKPAAAILASQEVTEPVAITV